ncbi:HNH endonuclease [Candidatus Desulfovibrio trichonymphae]|uniref:HNH endonuclease n=1 Tax=Candidatus Desulfovibrio trichonymphae TaxID=1725232 RepID=UPI0018D51407
MTEMGWPIVTHTNGRPDLPVGIYVLEEDRQAPQASEHDRQIPDAVRRAVLVRDHYICKDCGWTHDQWNSSDSRHLEAHYLEAHHITAHADGGSNTESNLVTLCNICHDVRHRKT